MDPLHPKPRLAAPGSRLRFWLLCVFIIAAAAVLYRNNPAQSGFFPPCPFHLLTGLYCPGCGSLRGLHQLLHGNLQAAFGLNPLMVSCLPLLGYSLVSYGRRTFSGRRGVSMDFIGPRHIWAFLAAVLVFGILRNIPVSPLAALAP